MTQSDNGLRYPAASRGGPGKLMNGLAIYCADIGSVAADNFGWARGMTTGKAITVQGGTDMRELVDAVARDLNANTPVALGFECPLFVPVRHEPRKLTSGRSGEGSRPWSAGAGAAVLATGITETVWILEEVKARLAAKVAPYLDWQAFGEAGRGLFLWEAFVTKEAKTDTHVGDAEMAVRRFGERLPDIVEANSVSEANVHSLLGAALLRTGWSDDLSLLKTSCVVIKA